jgi:hypothetical protein
MIECCPACGRELKKGEVIYAKEHNDLAIGGVLAEACLII